MTQRIFKYPLQITDEQHIEIPGQPIFLSAQFQGDQLCLWALVFPDNPKVLHTFRIVGTGHPLPDDMGFHIGTVQQPGMPLVWHVFEGS
jgi:hypothetical protein